MFSSLATPPSISPTAIRPGIRLMSVNDERVIWTLSSSSTSASSVSSSDRLQPQQPHRLIVAICTLASRAFFSSGSSALAGISWL